MTLAMSVTPQLVKMKNIAATSTLNGRAGIDTDHAVPKSVVLRMHFSGKSEFDRVWLSSPPQQHNRAGSSHHGDNLSGQGLPQPRTMSNHASRSSIVIGGLVG